MESTVSPRASSISVTVEPTWPEPPVTNTFMLSFLNYTAIRLSEAIANQRLVRCRTVVKDLVPELEAEKAPDLSREAFALVEIDKNGIRVEKRTRLALLCREDIEQEVSQLAPEPFLQRHRKAHLVAPLHERPRQVVGKGGLHELLHPAVLELHVGRNGRGEFHDPDGRGTARATSSPCAMHMRSST